MIRFLFVLFFHIFIIYSLSAQKLSKKINLGTTFTYTFFSHDNVISSKTLSSSLELKYSTRKNYYYEIQAGISYTNIHLEETGIKSRIDFANPIITFGKSFFVNIVNKKVESQIAFKVGIPLATLSGNIPDNRLSEFNLNNANSGSGWQNPYLWTMNILPIIINTNYKTEIIDNYYIYYDLSPAWFISLNKTPSKLCFINKLNIAYENKKYSCHLGYNYFYSHVSLENNDYDQSSFLLGAKLKTSRINYQIDLNVNLDSPNGIFINSTKPKFGISLKISK